MNAKRAKRVGFVRRQRYFIAVAFLALAVSIGDVLTTYILVPRSGFYEANPIMDALIQHHGIGTFAWINAVLSVLLLAGIMTLSLVKEDSRYHVKRYVPVLIILVLRGVAFTNNMLHFV